MRIGITETTEEDFREGRQITYRINPQRLAAGVYDHSAAQNVGEGDIYASYSADITMGDGKIRRPFQFQSQLMVAVCVSGRVGPERAEAYNLFAVEAHHGTPFPYREQMANADAVDAAHGNANGFYHGMVVKWDNQTFVLRGPPVVFMGDQDVRPAEAGGSQFLNREEQQDWLLSEVRPRLRAQPEKPLQLNLFDARRAAQFQK